MNNELTWHFDAVVIEWLIVLTTLVILAIVGAVVTRRTHKDFRRLKVQSDALDSVSESWHFGSAKAVLESL